MSCWAFGELEAVALPGGSNKLEHALGPLWFGDPNADGAGDSVAEKGGDGVLASERAAVLEHVRDGKGERQRAEIRHSELRRELGVKVGGVIGVGAQPGGAAHSVFAVAVLDVAIDGGLEAMVQPVGADDSDARLTCVCAPRDLDEGGAVVFVKEEGQDDEVSQPPEGGVGGSTTDGAGQQELEPPAVRRVALESSSRSQLHVDPTLRPFLHRHLSEFEVTGEFLMDGLLCGGQTREEQDSS